MNGLRQAQEETVPSRSAAGLNERLATPSRRRIRDDRSFGPWLMGELRRIDGVATPALFGTTAAWLTGSFLMGQIGTGKMAWTPSITTLLYAFMAAIALSIPLTYCPKRWYGWYAAFATLVGMSLACAYSYGEYQAARWPWPSDENIALRSAQQNFWGIAFGVLLTAVIWLPVVMAVFQVRKTLAERIRENQR